MGLQDVVTQRLGKSTIGFNGNDASKIDNWENNLETRDLVKFGLIPEFIGRLPSVNILEELTKEDLIQILQNQHSIINQIQELFLLDKIQIEFKIKALEEVANIATKQQLGARGLRKILDNALLDIRAPTFRAPEQGVKKVIVTEQVITLGHGPVMIKSE